MILTLTHIGVSCVPLKGSYIPLGENVENPYNQYAYTSVYNPILKDSIKSVDLNQIPFPNSRPFRDTIEFISGKYVRAWSRPNTISTCSMKVSRLEEVEYIVKKDTLISEHVHYLLRGDTLYPLHHGSIYVKE